MSAREFDFGMADARQQNGREEIDLGGIAAALADRKRLVALSTLGAATAALLFCLAVKPRYVAESRILIENQESYFTRAAPDGAPASEIAQALDTEAVNSQIQLLTSRDLALKAVGKLGLRGNSEFDPAAGGVSLLTRPLALFGIGADNANKPVEDRLLSAFIDHLTVMSPSKTRVLQIEFSSHDPDLAARGANAVAEIYIDLKSEAKREDARQAAQALKPLIASLETKVAEAEAKVEAFRAKTGFYESSENTSVPTQQLGQIATKLAEARTAQSEAEAKARSLRDLLKQGRLGDAGDIASNDLVKRIVDQRVAVRSQLAVESRTLLPGHPRIKELDAQLSDLETQLRAAVEKAARGLDNDARVAAVRVANLTALLDEQKSAVGASNTDAAQLHELQRDAKILKDQLASLASKYQAALARDVADSAPPDARIISRALAPSQPVFPKKTPIVMFAAMAGLFFSIVFTMAREMMGADVRTVPRRAPRQAPPGPVEAAIASPVSESPRAAAAFGEEKPTKDEGFFSRVKQAAAEFAAPAVPMESETPKTASAPEIKPSLDRGAAPAKARIGASRAVIERIVTASPHGAAKVLVVADPEAAPACASLTLARALAREGRAILVQIGDSDAALSEALSKAEGRDELEGARSGLAQLLCGEASFGETIYRDGASRLHIVRSGGALQADADDLDLILDALHATYDFVLLAAAPGREAARIAGDADLTMIYAENGRARDFLSDDFAASGARAILMAGRDTLGEIVEMAA